MFFTVQSTKVKTSLPRPLMYDAILSVASLLCSTQQQLSLCATCAIAACRAAGQLARACLASFLQMAPPVSRARPDVPAAGQPEATVMATLASLPALAGSGVVLSLPHASGMQSSLPILKKNYKFSKVFFWGKLQGLKNDYLIAKGIEESYTAAKFFYCIDGVSWAQLPAVTAEMAANVATVTTHGLLLSGDDSATIALPVPEVPGGEDPPEGEPPVVTELERIAAMVAEIDAECAMCPAGALIKKADGTVTDSPTFTGLAFEKAKSAAAYTLMNKTKDVSPNADALTASTDFLTSCGDVVPTGSLTSKFDESSAVVTWRSLLYPGFMAYANVGSPVHGYCYVGTGLKNSDVAFMLP